MAATRTALFFDVFAVDRTRATFASISKSTDTLGGKIARFGKIAAGAAAAGAVAFAGQGVRSFLEFDDKLNQSLAIMGEVSGPMRQRMSDAAREIGRTSRFGASQAAEAYFFLASAGLDAEQSVAALPQVAKFAQAGMFDLARATDLATDAQSALGMAAKDPEQNLRNLTRVTDVLVGANTLANASVEQFSTALTNKAGPAMRQANMRIESGVAVLAAWADQGVKGEAAGTRFAATLEGLQRNAINNRDAFADLGIRVFDSSGNMRNMADIVADLENALGDMSLEQQKAALMQLGFNRQALDGIVSLLGLSGQIRTYEGDLRNMAGITDEVAGKQLESFQAKLDILKSRIGDFGMAVGEVLVNAAFEVGETVGEMARIFGELPEPVQTSILAATGVVAAAPLVIGAWRRIRAMIESVRMAYLAMGTTARIATLSLGVVGVALAAGAAVLAFFARQNMEASARVDELKSSLDRQSGAVTQNSREIAAKMLADRGALDAAEKLGLSLETVTDAALGDAEAMAEVRRVTDDAADSQRLAAERFGQGAQRVTEQEEAAQKLNRVLDESVEELEEATRQQRQHAEAVGGGTDAQDDFAGQLDEANGLIQQQVSDLDELIRKLDESTKTVFAARDAERGFEQALDDAWAALERNGATLDITTEKGRENERVLDRLAERAAAKAAKTLEDAEANGTLAEAQDEVTREMQRAREEFIAVARAMGLSKVEAEELANELGLIPGEYAAIIEANTKPARDNVVDFLAWAGRQRATMPVSATGEFHAFASGGFARRGTTAIVGEEGPELVRFGSNAQVFSNQDTVAMLREALRGGDGASQRSPGGDIHVHLTAYSDWFSTKQVMDDLAMRGAV